MSWLPRSETSWADLEHGSMMIGHLRARQVLLGERGALMAIDAVGARHLLLRAVPEEKVTSDTGGRVLKLEERILDGEGGGRFADFSCSDYLRNELFGIMAEEVLTRLTDNEGSGPEIALKVLRNWRALLALDHRQVMPLEKQVGLFGELLVLQWALSIDPLAVDYWLGPSGARHDFSGPGGAMEVKSILAQHQDVVVVNGLDQLMAPPDMPLWLRIIRLERSGAGRTLPQLIDEVAAKATHPDDLRAKAAEAGYEEGFESDYATFRFAPKGERTFVVDDTVPRLIVTDLKREHTPPGIGKVQYSLDIGAVPGSAEVHNRGAMYFLRESV